MSHPTARNSFSTGLRKRSANPSPWSRTSPQDCKNERGVAHQTKGKLERAPATVPVEKNLAMFLRTRRGGISKPSLGFRGALLGGWPILLRVLCAEGGREIPDLKPPISFVRFLLDSPLSLLITYKRTDYLRDNLGNL